MFVVDNKLRISKILVHVVDIISILIVRGRVGRPNQIVYLVLMSSSVSTCAKLQITQNKRGLPIFEMREYPNNIFFSNHN